MNTIHEVLRPALATVLGGLLVGSAQAGDSKAVLPAAEPESSPGDWCEWLSKKPGTLYKNADNPWIQEFGIFGRFQWQAAYLWGEDTNGYEFSDDYTEVRRFRLGAKIKFLNFFEAKANANLVDDARNSVLRWPGGDRLGWGYEDFDEAYLAFDIKKAFGVEWLDSLAVSYGRHKFELSQEARMSSKQLLTVERSAISNKVYGSYRPTGVHLEASRGAWSAIAGLYSTDALTRVGGNIDFIGGWNDGLAYFTSVGFQACDELRFTADFVYNDADQRAGEDNLWGYRWATSLSAEYDAGEWGLVLDGIYGDNGSGRLGNLAPNRQGDFWGIVVMPYYWLVENKLQGVVRYQYQGSEEARGIRVNSRYARRDHGFPVNATIAGGRGNTHHSIYGGLNWLICGHNLKVQTGLEYEWLNAPGAGTEGEVSALTAWFGFRSFF